IELRRWREAMGREPRKDFVVTARHSEKFNRYAPSVEPAAGKAGSRVGQQTFLKMVLTHNRNDSDITARIRLRTEPGGGHEERFSLPRDGIAAPPMRGAQPATKLEASRRSRTLGASRRSRNFRLFQAMQRDRPR